MASRFRRRLLVVVARVPLGSPVDVPESVLADELERAGGILSNHEATANVVFFYSNKTLYRLSARTAEVEAVWRYRLSFVNLAPRRRCLPSPPEESSLSTCPSDPMPCSVAIRRWRSTGTVATVFGRLRRKAEPRPRVRGCGLLASGLFRRQTLAFATGLRDSTWRLDFDSGDPQTVNDKYVYMWSMPLGVSTPGWPRGVARAPIADGG